MAGQRTRACMEPTSVYFREYANMADLSKLVDELSSLTVLEAAELSKLLEDKWGVSAAAPVAAAAAPPQVLPHAAAAG